MSATPFDPSIDSSDPLWRARVVDAVNKYALFPTLQAMEPLRAIWSPIWVYGSETGYIAWSNQAAVELWVADSEAELCGRYMPPLSDGSIIRVRRIIEQVLKDNTHLKPGHFIQKASLHAYVCAIARFYCPMATWVWFKRHNG